MKSILVATDFSDNANAAMEYALMLARDINAKLTLYHSYSILFPVPNVPQDIKDPEEYGRAVEKEMQRLTGSLGHTAPGVAVDYICERGMPVDAITNLVKHNKYDLVVMGIKGRDAINETLVGSFATDLIMKAAFPVLVVPQMARFNKINHIVLAVDCREIHNYDSLSLLKELAQHFSARINSVYIKGEGEENHSAEQEAVKCRLDEYFEGTEFSLHQVIEDDITAGVKEFSEMTQSDIVVMMPRMHSFFESIFKKSNTKKFAFNTNIPLLALPDVG